jgi:hypothetical protein
MLRRVAAAAPAQCPHRPSGFQCHHSARWNNTSGTTTFWKTSSTAQKTPARHLASGPPPIRASAEFDPYGYDPAGAGCIMNIPGRQRSGFPPLGLTPRHQQDGAGCSTDNITANTSPRSRSRTVMSQAEFTCHPADLKAASPIAAAAAAIRDANALVFTAGAGFGIDSEGSDFRESEESFSEADSSVRNHHHSPADDATPLWLEQEQTLA